MLQPTSLLLPSTQSPAAPVTVPDAASHDVDHFLCYKAKLLEKSTDGVELPGIPNGTQVDVVEAFQPRRYELKKVSKICNPVAKTGSPVLLAGPSKGDAKLVAPATIGDSATHLVCYTAKPARKHIEQSGCGPQTPDDKGTKIEPKPEEHSPRTGLYVANQCDSARFDSVREFEFCIPSHVNVPVENL